LSVIHIDHQQAENAGTEGKVLQRRPPLHNVLKIALDIIPKKD